uniref:lipid-A-disaccharide synthase n=1 Tax=Alistipes sp. TaxID=1872444 RepID=UPI004056C68D
MKYFIFAGEPSGDLHGAKLIRGIKAEDPKAEFRFCGGDDMVAAAGEKGLLMHYKEMSFFGLFNVLRNLITIFGQIRRVKEEIASFRPDVVILIDYPSFNMRIAKWCKAQGIKVFYYIAPKVWAWKEWRVKGIRNYVDRLFTIFPFETTYFREKGIEPIFCGNPLVDDIAERRRSLPERELFLRENGLDERPIIALLAGSRPSEIKANLPDMVALSKEFPAYQFIVTAVPWIDRARYEELLKGSAVRYLCGQTQQTLALSEAAVVTSGTATLETALMGIPEMVLYHVPKLYELLRPYVLRIPWVSLVNINMRREVVREMVCAKLDLKEATEELRSLLKGGQKRDKMLEEFARLQALIGGEGASRRFAQAMVKALQEE